MSQKQALIELKHKNDNPVFNSPGDQNNVYITDYRLYAWLLAKVCGRKLWMRTRLNAIPVCDTQRL